MTAGTPRFVADIGNSRVKIARVRPEGTLCDHTAWPLVSGVSWEDALRVWVGSLGRAEWAIATVNAPASTRLEALIEDLGGRLAGRVASAADVPAANRLESLSRTGADRSLAVLAATHHLRRFSKVAGPGQVILCGTALTVERIDDSGVWDGGAILPGLTTASRALQQNTAQLPRVVLGDASTTPAWGRSTEPAIAAGVFWGAVGALREILDRQATTFPRPPLRIWTGGDADRLAPAVEGPHALVIPDLVLQGLVGVVFGSWAVEP